MKIEGILQKDDYFYITIVPNWWEKFMGIDDMVVVYKQVGRVHKETNEPIYIDKDGSILDSDSEIAYEINRFIRKKLFYDKEVNLNMN